MKPTTRRGSAGISRRRFVQIGAAGLGALTLPPAWGKVLLQRDCRLRFHNLHTGESLAVTYRCGGHYVPAALRRVDHLLRDFRTGQTHSIDPSLLDLLHTLSLRLGADEGCFHVISGYRSPATNRLLRSRSRGVAQHSLHMVGKAIDIRLPGCRLSHLHAQAVAMRAGGVGYYPHSDFVHVDTGRVRYW